MSSASASLVRLFLLSPLALPVAIAAPSFDCRTATTARELATCADAKIAMADRELAVVWQNAITHLDAVTVKALRADQKEFLEDLDNGFEHEVWGKESPPKGKELRAQIARMRRGGDFDALAELETQLHERVAFLRNLTPAASYAGLWKNHDSELLVTAADGNASYSAMFGTTTFGAPKFECHFTAKFHVSGGGLAAEGAHRTDPEMEKDTASTLFLVRSGAILRLTEEEVGNAAQDFLKALERGTGSSPDELKLSHICRRFDLDHQLFHTGLKQEQAYRLKPGD